MIGENFPYTNFHDMNLDWMIKIAKDFLDQYTQIQETIETGLQDLDDKTDAGIEGLQDKYDALKDLLDSWYSEHSEDIAGDLADALEDLSEAVTAAGTAMDEKALETISSIPDDYSTLSSSAIKNNVAYVSNNSYSTVLPNANSATANTVYMLFGNNIGTTNLPQTNFNATGILRYYKADQLKVQILTTENIIYTRVGYGNDWNPWTKYVSAVGNAPIGLFAGYVSNSNYGTNLPDANSAIANTRYVLFGTNIQTAHFPRSNFKEGGLFTYIKTDLLKIQYIEYDGVIWRRSGYDSSWNDWEVYSYSRKIIRIGGYTPDFEKLTDGLAYAYDRGYCDVYVDYGTYDIFSELGGSTYFNPYTFTDGEFGGGPVVGHECRYYFAPNAFVQFHNTTDNQDVCETFSPINAGNGSFYIEGLNIRASKCRYCIHDELGHSGLNNRNTIEHTYKNLDASIDNSNNTYFERNECIGGGLIPHGGELVNIHDSYFSSAVADSYLVTYHNGVGGSGLPSKSKITVSGCYFDNGGTFRSGSYGDNPNRTVVFLSNNSFGAEPVNNLETESSTTNINMIKWNNIVRT